MAMANRAGMPSRQVTKGAPQGRSGIRMLAWVVALLLFLAASLAAAQGTKPEKSAAPSDSDSRKQFTIQKIEPDAANEEVRIFFSQPIPIGVVRANLRLLPPIKIDWDASSISGNGVLTLKGSFRYGSRHLVSLPDNLMVRGRSYVKTMDSFIMPHQNRMVEFIDNKSVIERDSRQLLQVRARNLDGVVFEGIKVPPLILPLALAMEKSSADWSQALPRLKAAMERVGSLVQGRQEFRPFLGQPAEEKQFFPLPSAKDKLKPISLPLSFRKDKETGVLELIRVRENRDGGASTEPRVFRITDLGLTYKLAERNLLLWVTSIKSGTPVAGAQILGFTKGMEAFPLGVTDKDGVLLFTPKELEGLSLAHLDKMGPVKRQVDPDNLVALLAGTPEDVSFITLQPQGFLKPEGVRQVQVGEKVRNFKGQVFTERGVYRPGEKVYFKGAVREYVDGRIIPPQNETCSFEILNPKNEQIYSNDMTLNEFGTAFGEMETAAYFTLGTYTLNMRFGEGEPQQPEKRRRRAPRSEEQKEEGEVQPMVSTTFLVQEFTPPRHFVEVSFNRFTRPLKEFVNRTGVGEFVRISLASDYYAGGPVKHGQVRWKVYKSRTDYKVPGYDGFTFGWEGEEKGELIESGQAILDDQGRTELEFPLDRLILSGRQGLMVVATVLDFDGRAASASKIFQVDPDILVGISSHAKEVPAEEEQLLKVVVVQRDGKKIKTGTVRAEVLQQSWNYVAKRNEKGDVYWTDQMVWRKLSASDLPLKNGEAVFRFDFAWGDQYVISFTYQDAKGQSFASATGYTVSGGYAWRGEEGKEKPYEALSLAADRPSYTPGQTAMVMVYPKRPVSRYLLTLEQEGVMEYRVITADKGLEQWEIPIKAAYAPNVYVSVLGLTPRGEFPVYAGRYDTEAPGFFWGNLNLPVLKEVETLQVKISPKVKDLKAEPGGAMELDFIVQAPDGKGVAAEMAVAVVDERILALTGYKTPTLEQLVRFDRALSVYTGELRTLLQHQTPYYVARIDPLTGGGGLEPGAEGLNGKLRKRFDPVAYFNPALRTDAKGQAHISFTLPDTMTTYRVYAVVLDRGSRFASVERPLLVTRDFYLEPGLPDFFTQGDRFQFQVAAFNASDAKGTVKVTATPEGELKLAADAPSAPLGPKDSTKLLISGEAVAPGPAAIRFDGVFNGKTDAVLQPLTINSGFVRETTVFAGSLTISGEIKLDLPAHITATPWDKVGLGEVKAVLTLSGSPFLRMTPAFRYLLTYPYGCVEQTASGVIPLAALRGLITNGLVPGVTLEETDRYLTAGVARLLKMQTDSGGFAYWPGQRLAHPWGSLYAASALSLAKAEGLDLSEDAFTSMVNYLKNQVKTQETPAGVKAFACYILSLNGELEPGLLDSLTYRDLSRESKLLFLLAAHRAKQRSLADLQAALKPLLTPEALKAKDADDLFMARYRPLALALLAGKAMLPNEPGTKEAALMLLRGLDRQGIWSSTSDTGWALLALGEYFKDASFGQEPEEITVEVAGAPSQRLSVDPKGFRSVSLDPKALLKNPAVRLTSAKQRTWLYKVELTAPRVDIADKGLDHGFKVWKTIRNTDGSDQIKVGDLVKVTVFLEPSDRRTRDFVVLDDPLPAGLVAINSAFKTEEETPGRGDDNEDEYFFDYFSPEGYIRFRPNFFEIRHDRVLAFRDQVYTGTYQFEYYARATCQGDFVLPATKVMAMYAPADHGLSVRSRLAIQGR